MINQNVEKMITYLKGYFQGGNMHNSIKALQFARKHHAHQTRKEGTPYIIHPLRMACYAAALGVQDDDLISTILCHDIVEDCNVPLELLPISKTAKSGVKYMTIEPYADEPKKETKRRYFNQLLESRESLLCKAFDRYDNLSTMAGVISDEAIIKNIHETNELLLPVLKKARDIWIDDSNLIHALRTNIQGINNTLAKIYLKNETDGGIHEQ